MGDKKIALVEKMVQFAEQEAASGDYLNAIIILDKNAKELKEFISKQMVPFENASILLDKIVTNRESVVTRARSSLAKKAVQY